VGGQTRENCGAHNAMQRRCTEPRRQHCFRCFSPWRGLVHRPRVRRRLARGAARRQAASGGRSNPRNCGAHAAPTMRCNDVARSRVPSIACAALARGAARRQGASAGAGQIKSRVPWRPQPNATTLRGSAKFAVSPARLISVAHPPGYMGSQREPQIILKRMSARLSMNSSAAKINC
jgi:hypothetical protein